MFFERRRPALTRQLLAQVGLIWLFVAAIQIAIKWTAIRNFELPDADDTLRLIQLRDLVAGQGWFDLVQHRLNPPHGVLMHWSRLVDLPLLAVYSALAPLLGSTVAERATLVIVPLLTMAATALLAARIAWRVIDDRLVPYTGLLLGISVPLTMQLSPMRIDHHGWQVVAVLGAANGLMARDPRRGAWIMALSLGLGMAISIELLPITALFSAVLALRWLRDTKQRVWLAHFLPTLVVIGTLAVLATHGTTDLVNHCDTLSPAYLIGLAVAAMGTGLLALRAPMQPVMVMAGLSASAMAALAAGLIAAPQCARGPFPMLDPLVQHLWYDNVSEGMPVWNTQPGIAIMMLLGPLVGLMATTRLVRRSSGWLRGFWFDYAVLLAGLIVLAMLVMRSASFAYAIALPPFAWQCREWHSRSARFSSPPRRVAAFMAITMIALPIIPVALAQQFTETKEEAAQKNQPAPQEICSVPAAAPALETLPASTVFAPIDLGPMVLAYSHHSVVASAHHRGAVGIHDVLEAFLARPDNARRIIASHNAGYVLVCPGMNEISHYTVDAPDGLMAALVKGKPPEWLTPIVIPGKTGLLLWRVVPLMPARS